MESNRILEIIREVRTDGYFTELEVISIAVQVSIETSTNVLNTFIAKAKSFGLLRADFSPYSPNFDQ